MLDPRKDLQQDTIFWELVLACATAYKNNAIFANLHGLRCGGAQLILKDSDLLFKFPQDWDEETKQNMKKKYALPYAKQFKTLFKFTAEYYAQHKQKLNEPKYHEKDYLGRDLFTEGFLP